MTNGDLLNFPEREQDIKLPYNCEPCRRARTKCDKTGPVCRRCARKGLCCSGGYEKPKRGRPSVNIFNRPSVVLENSTTKCDVLLANGSSSAEEGRPFKRPRNTTIINPGSSISCPRGCPIRSSSSLSIHGSVGSSGRLSRLSSSSSREESGGVGTTQLLAPSSLLPSSLLPSSLLLSSSKGMNHPSTASQPPKPSSDPRYTMTRQELTWARKIKRVLRENNHTRKTNGLSTTTKTSTNMEMENALFTDLFIAQLAIVTRGDVTAAMKRCNVINEALVKYNIKTTPRELELAVDWVNHVLPGFHQVRSISTTSSFFFFFSTPFFTAVSASCH